MYTMIKKYQFRNKALLLTSANTYREITKQIVSCLYYDESYHFINLLAICLIVTNHLPPFVFETILPPLKEQQLFKSFNLLVEDMKNK